MNDAGSPVRDAGSPATDAGPAAADRGAAGGPVALRDPAYRVSRRAIGYWAVRAALPWAVLTAGQAAWLASAATPPGFLPYTLGAGVVLGIAHALVMPRWRYHVHRWEATEQAVFTKAGWFTVEWRIAPISRLQTVDSGRGLVERVFGLANVTLTTASAAGPIEIEGLARADADRLVAELTARTQATTGDAT